MKKYHILLLILCCNPIIIFSSSPAARSSKKIMIQPRKIAGFNDQRIAQLQEELKSKSKNFTYSAKENFVLSYINALTKIIDKETRDLSPEGKQILILEELEVKPKQLTRLLHAESEADKQRRAKILALKTDIHETLTNFAYKNPEAGFNLMQQYYTNSNKKKIAQLNEEIARLLNEQDLLYKTSCFIQEEDAQEKDEQ